MASGMEGNSSSYSLNPQAALLDTFFPGFSLLSAALSKYLKVDVALYIPAILAIGLLIAGSQYAIDYFWEKMENHFMSTADIRVDDEIYNMFISWIAAQKFAKTSRRFVPQTNLNSRSWALWRFTEDNDDELDNEDSDSGHFMSTSTKRKRPLQYTPSFGTHYFWYKGRLLLFKRTQTSQPQGFMPVSEREEMSISLFGRNPTVLKELLDECRVEYMKHDENRTIIYRGAMKPGTTEPTWTRCMSRISRPFSTVVLDDSVKQSLLEDMQDYLHPLTQRWYANRGIPYRRGYLLHGPPGTGKSSLSFAVAGYFKLKIYIVSLNSLSMNEENLSTLFAELPKKCVVLLEDIDTAGLTNTRQKSDKLEEEPAKRAKTAGGAAAAAAAVATNNGRISLSALLNVIDGVASQEGRVLIMTTNHIEKLDEALIRPGRVDMTVEFDLADKSMVKTLFKGIYATLEGDLPKSKATNDEVTNEGPRPPTPTKEDSEAIERLKLENEKAEEARTSTLADEFAMLIPSRVFSPAEVQGFLLKNKRNPEAAVRGAEQWVKDTLAQKEKHKKAEKERLAKAEEDRMAEEKKVDEDATSETGQSTSETNITAETGKIEKGTRNGIDKATMTNGIIKESAVNGIETNNTNGVETT